ncbi:stress response protein NST1-like [Senna tora]|uniref:Stress response protein NST1-like n=1 Tax=Senna tora TaxID=362788 RepID=A0A834W7C2_9FABA|nr:stress response protein NST1-like [Senna tora]
MLFKASKNRLLGHYKKFSTDGERLDRPIDVTLEDWMWLCSQKRLWKKPINKRAREQIDVEASVSSVIEVVRDQMQAELDRKHAEYERKILEECNELQLKEQREAC